MSVNQPVVQSSVQPSAETQSQTLSHAQEALYALLFKAVKTWSAADVLQEFKQIFIQPTESVSSEIIPALYRIILTNQEEEFRNTLKRSCYILVNNWEIVRDYQPIQDLIHLFTDPILEKPTASPTLKRLRQWLKNFAESADFEELKLFAQRYDNRTTHWRYRYTPYLLVSQYTNLSNPEEQRQAARSLYIQLREKFKFELAMYTAHSERLSIVPDHSKNPTQLGDEVLLLIKKVLAKRGFFNYSNLARIFLNQVKYLEYERFKSSFLEYLIFSSEQNENVERLREQLSEKLNSLYVDHHQRIVDNSLILRTSNRLIDYLTTDSQEPSPLFISLLSKGHSLTLVILLLKIILVCPYARTHLETRVADLIRHYEQYSEEECQWMIYFLEVFNITMTIYTENVEYSLVKVSYGDIDAAIQPSKAFRIFSQIKRDRSFTGSQRAERIVLEDSLDDNAGHMETA